MDLLRWAAQHTDVWRVPRPNINRIGYREQTLRHIQRRIQSRFSFFLPALIIADP